MTPPSARQLMSMALPLMGSLLASISMLIVDGIACGHIADHGVSLTALGYGVQIWFLLAFPMMSALGVGTVAIASRAHGAGDTARVNHVLAQSTQLAVLAGIVLGAVCIAAGSLPFRALGASPEVAAKGASYLRMMMFALPVFLFADGCLAAALRSVGKPRLPFATDLAATLVNVLLNYGLVFGHFGLPELGIAGAGLATAISRVLSVGLLVAVIHANNVGGLRVRLRVVAIDRPIVQQILRVGLPALFERVIFYASMTALIWILARVDETSVAAHGIGSRVAALLLIPAFGLSMATGALVGKALGAGSADDARRIVRLSSLAVLAIMVPIAAATFIGAGAITAAYDVVAGSPLDAYTVSWLRLIALSVVLQGVLLAFEGLLMGAGASRTVMRINLIANLGLRVTLAMLLGLATDLGAVGVWLSWPAALLVQLPLVFVAYRRGRWAVTGVGVK